MSSSGLLDLECENPASLVSGDIDAHSSSGNATKPRNIVKRIQYALLRYVVCADTVI